MHTLILLVLLLLPVASFAQNGTLNWTNDGGNGWAAGESVAAADMNEIKTEVDACLSEPDGATLASGVLSLDQAATPGELRLLEGSAGGTNYVSLASPSTLGANRNCVLEDDANPIPDSCVGDGSDAAGSSVWTDADPMRQTVTTRNIIIGSDATNSAKLEIGADADETGLIIQTFAGQDLNDAAWVVQDSDGNPLSWVAATGEFVTLNGAFYGPSPTFWLNDTVDVDASPEARIVGNAVAADNGALTFEVEIADNSYAHIVSGSSTAGVYSGRQDGKVLRNSIAVDDDDCTGEQGKWWYDTTDSAFEFCNANSGAPIAVASTGGAAPLNLNPWVLAFGLGCLFGRARLPRRQGTPARVVPIRRAA